MMPPLSRRFRRFSLAVVAAVALSLFAVVSPLTQSTSIASAATPGVDFFENAKVGLFTHYTYSYPGYQYGHTYNEPGGALVTDLDTLADSFDAERFADVAESMGAQYVTFTAFHAGMSMLYPSVVMGSKLSSKVSQRDLIADLIDQLSQRDIKLVLYFHPVDGVDLTPQEKTTLGWGDFTAWNDFINALVDEIGDRYGSDVAGFWFDGSPAPSQIDYSRLKSTVLAGNPNAAVWVNYAAQFNEGIGADGLSDLLTSEYFPTPAAGYDSDQWPTDTSQASIRVGSEWWAMGNGSLQMTAEEMLRYTVRNAGTTGRGNGGVHWAAGPYANGDWETGVEQELSEYGTLLGSIADAVYDTVPSESYVTANKTLQTNTWGVATDSADGNHVYLHVLNPPSGSTLTIPTAYDGREFDTAKLVEGGATVAVTQTSSGYDLTLPSGSTWNQTDTVIDLNVSVASFKDRDVPHRFAVDAAIQDGTETLAETEVGSGVGQYPQLQTTELEVAVSAAESVLTSATSVFQDGVDAAQQIRDAIDALLASVVVEPASGNLAAGKPVTVSSQHPTWPASLAVDGVREAPNVLGWSSSDASYNVNHTESIQVDLQAPETIDRVLLFPTKYPTDGDSFPLDFVVKVSSNGSTWQTVASETNYPHPHGVAQRILFNSISARYVKVEATNLRQNFSDGGVYRFQLSELEVH